MKTYLALFRGVNVGGRNLLPMKSLKALLERDGCVDVRTYVQSGNVVFRSAMGDSTRLAKRLAAAIAVNYGFEPRVIVLTPAELERAAAGNPFAEADDNPKRLHLFFLAGQPTNADLEALEALKVKGDRFALKDRIFYLYTPAGFGISRLAQRTEKLLHVEATARNWSTVTALLKIVKG